MFKIKKQIRGLYLSLIFGNLSLTGAWVAILSARGYSLVEIGIAETVFHITSLLFEIPSGVFADIFGRKKMLMVGSFMRLMGNIVMICSRNFYTVCLSMAFQALSYNFVSGSNDALAYDSLKKVQLENEFERYLSNQLVIYAVCGGLSTLCVGVSLSLGYKTAYGIDVIFSVVTVFILLSLYEIYGKEKENGKRLWNKLYGCFKESFVFIKNSKAVMSLMLCNVFIGALATLLLFFLQAKLTEHGIPEKLLGTALMFMEMGGIVGSKLILKLKNLKYKNTFLIASFLVVIGYTFEHSSIYFIMVFGGFLSALADDALQVRTNAKIQDMIPSEQRATLTSVESFLFSSVMIVLSPLAGIFFSKW